MPQAVTTKDEALSINAGGEKQQSKANAKMATPHVAANETTVSATLTDLGGNVWSGALITINFVPAPNIPGPYMWGGGPFSIRPQITADSNGYFSITLPDNLTITPAGSMWQFVIAPAATMPAVIFQLMVAGASMDISSIFTSQSYQVSLGAIQSLPVPRAYSDSEVATPPNTGQIYFDSTANELKVFVKNQFQAGGANYWAPIASSAASRQPDGTDCNQVLTGGFYDFADPENGPPINISDPETFRIGLQVWPTADPNFLVQYAWGMTEWGSPTEIWARMLRPDGSGGQAWTGWVKFAQINADNVLNFGGSLLTEAIWAYVGSTAINNPIQYVINMRVDYASGRAYINAPSQGLYLNYDVGSDGIYFGNGSGAVVAHLDNAGNLSIAGTLIQNAPL